MLRGDRKISDRRFAKWSLAEMAKKHSNEAFYAFGDPLKPSIFSVLVELMKELEQEYPAKREEWQRGFSR